MSDDKKQRGRPRLDLEGDDYVKHVGLKMPASLEKRFIDKARELRDKGFKTNKSELIRTLAEYWLDYAEEVYTEKAGNG